MTTQISQKQYAQTYLYLMKKAKSENLNDIFAFIESSDVKDTTKLNYLNSIIGLKKHDSKLVKGDLSKITEFRDKLGNKVEVHRKKDNMSDKQKNVFAKVKMEDIEKVISKLAKEKATDPKALEDYILLRLMNPPMRNDLMEIKICKQKGLLKEQNCIYIPSKAGTKSTISIIDHKTSHAGNRHPITREIDAKLTDDIRKLTKDKTYLFENGKGKPYSSSSFSHKLSNIFQKHLGIKFSSTMMRKLYLTNKYKDVLDDMKKDAEDMGHDMATAQKIYVNNN